MVLEMKDTFSTTRSKQTNSKPTVTVVLWRESAEHAMGTEGWPE